MIKIASLSRAVNRHRVLSAPWIFVYVTGIFISSACSTQTISEPQSTVPQLLIQQVSSRDARTRRTALYLLGELVLNENQLGSLEMTCSKLTNPIDQLFCQYSLAMRLQSEENTLKFVSLFPTDEHALSALLTETTQHVFPSGLFELLADAARYNDIALKKLVLACRSADTVAATLLNDLLDDVRNRNQERYKSVIRNENQ